MSEGHTGRLEAALTGSYRMERKLGEGGMASVYLAHDLKHERRVALKILRPELAAVIGAERFLSEIKTTANLQHPHILPLFDSGNADGYLYYVMPYIDGETLRQKLDREKQLGIEEAVRVARDVADALDYAHRRGVIHRDIKPGNILLHDGRPVVADFGIALAVSAAGGGRMTETGLSLGTPHYMSPEQASADRDLSARSDIYSLGCVLYEMIAGQPPHTGPSAQSILVHILTKEVAPLTELRRTVPPHVAAAVTKAIEKLPADRFETARAFRDALQDTGFRHDVSAAASGSAAVHPAGIHRGASARAHAAATALLAATTLFFGWSALRGQPSDVAARGGMVSFVLPTALDPTYPPIVGSNGAIVVPRPRPTGGLDILRPGALTLAPLEGTEGAIVGALSPDVRWLAFLQPMAGQTGMALRRMPSDGGPISTLWESPTALRLSAGVAWADDGWIYVAIDGLLGRVPEDGGPLDSLVSGQGYIRNPVALPGGDAVLYTLAYTDVSPENRVMLVDVASRDTATIIEDGFDASWVDTGHLVYAHSGGALYALPVDLRRMMPTGPPTPVLDEVAVVGDMAGRFAVSTNGTLVYARGAPDGGAAALSFALVNQDGEVEPLPLETDHADAALSPDGARVAYTREGNIWLYDLDGGRNRALTDVGVNHHNPIWSPDGSEVVFMSLREGYPSGDLYARVADGSAAARRIGGLPDISDFPAQWLTDGTILFDGLTPSDIYRISATGDLPPESLLEADWSESAPRVSPDGRWLAYRSDEDGGVPHLFVRRWPDLGGRTQLTSGEVGGGRPAWSADSRTLYVRRGTRLWTATLVSDAPSFTLRDTGVDLPGAIWDYHPDGRLLIQTTLGAPAGGTDAQAPQLVVVTNWLRALEERLEAGSAR